MTHRLRRGRRRRQMPNGRAVKGPRKGFFPPSRPTPRSRCRYDIIIRPRNIKLVSLYARGGSPRQLIKATADAHCSAQATAPTPSYHYRPLQPHRKCGSCHPDRSVVLPVECRTTAKEFYKKGEII